MIGKKVVIPLTNKIIPIISDEYADPKKGSGAVKITPAHDFNDFLVGKKHKIPIINILDKEAKLNKNVPSKFIGLDRYHARKKIIIMLKEKKQLEKIVKNKMVVPVGDRSGSVIEPLLTKQWFLDSKKLSKKIQSSIKKKEICFHPKSWMNTFKYWIDNIEPWCISRQIWWGHRIPIWYTDNGKKIAATDLKDAEAFIKKNNLKCKITHQDSDVLDTWFSSALWPFSTLGWPDNSKKLKKHFPSDVLVTGFDIIFFWVARMIMMSLHFKKKIPFKNIYIHPLVRDEKGEKMSKSKGNVIDPLEIVNLYGADSLRFTLANLSTQGRDIKLSNKLIENSRNFITKIWNVARFAEFNNFSFDNNYSFSSNKLALNNWIVFRLYQTQQKILKYLKEYKFNLLLNELYHFVWNDFCDLYLEFSKIYIKTEDNVKEISNNFSSVFKIILNLLNPIIPFVTEEISKKLNYTDSTLYDELLENEIFVKNFKSKKINDFENVIKLIKLIRADFRNRKKNKSSLIIFSKIKVCWIDEYEKILLSILSLDKIIYSTYKKGSKFFIIANTKLSIVESGNNIIDETDIKQKIKFYKNEIQFFEKKLQNKNFIEKAPKKIVNENKFKLLEAKKNLKLLTN